MRLPIAGCFALVSFLAAETAVGQTSTVIIDVDSTVVLSCLSPLEFTISPSALSAAITGNPNSGAGVPVSAAPQTPTATNGRLVARFDVIRANLPGGALNRMAMTAVGCLVSTNPGGGTVSVDIDPNNRNSLLTGLDGSTVDIRSVRGRVYGSGGNFFRNFKYNRNLHAAGDVQIEFEILADLNDATRAGRHSSAVDGTFTIEVTAP